MVMGCLWDQCARAVCAASSKVDQYMYRTISKRAGMKAGVPDRGAV